MFDQGDRWKSFNRYQRLFSPFSHECFGYRPKRQKCSFDFANGHKLFALFAAALYFCPCQQLFLIFLISK